MKIPNPGFYATSSTRQYSHSRAANSITAASITDWKCSRFGNMRYFTNHHFGSEFHITVDCRNTASNIHATYREASNPNNEARLFAINPRRISGDAADDARVQRNLNDLLDKFTSDFRTIAAACSATCP